MSHPIVFASSTRPEGTTSALIKLAFEGIPHDLIDLSAMNFTDYDPEGRNLDDDFLMMAEQMVKHDLIVLACPVYWYAVPAIMKRFIDRWSDLLEGRKDIARKLQDKKIMVLAAYGNYPDGILYFEEPIRGTADYLGMNYLGTFYYYTGQVPQGQAENPGQLESFRDSLGV
jgi:putative NADPH-quinone reductase